MLAVEGVRSMREESPRSPNKAILSANCRRQLTINIGKQTNGTLRGTPSNAIANLSLSLLPAAAFCATQWATRRTICFSWWKWRWLMDASWALVFWMWSFQNSARDISSSLSFSLSPWSPVRHCSHSYCSSTSRRPGTRTCSSSSAAATSATTLTGSWTTKSSRWSRTRRRSPCFSPTVPSIRADSRPDRSAAVREEATSRGSRRFTVFGQRWLANVHG